MEGNSILTNPTVSTQHIANHLRQVHIGGNWTTSCLREHIAGLDWHTANKQLPSFNSITKLVFHINYYVRAITSVLQGNELQANDKYSFTAPAINSQEEWDSFTESVLNDAEVLALLIEQLPDSILNQNFVHEKYGTYFRNFHGLIEHTHYHLGQIVILRKIIEQQ
jgi:hypothetical protein